HPARREGRHLRHAPHRGSDLGREQGLPKAVPRRARGGGQLRQESAPRKARCARARAECLAVRGATLSRWLLLAVLVSPGRVFADYLSVTRAATVRAEPSGHAAVLSKEEPGATLQLTGAEQQNGYY